MPVISITPAAAKALVHETVEVAFLDVREHGQYGEGHPLFSVNCPYSRLEIAAPALVPHVGVPVLLLDAGDGIAERAAARLSSLGYEDLRIVVGGVQAWSAAGFGLFQGVNVPSKTLGEIIEHEEHPATIDAPTLEAWRKEGRNVLVFDARPPSEYRKMTIPGAVCIPNGELAHRFAAAVPDDRTAVVVTCAGRTRGLTGALGLRAAGVRNPVYALENGTQGWALAGLDLARGREAAPFPELDHRALAASRARAEALSAKTGIPWIGRERFQELARDRSRSLYLFDVRSAEEFAAGGMPGAVHAPSGQLVQATDQWVAIRRARLVLVDDTGLRALTAGLWLRRLGFEVFVLPIAAEVPAGWSGERPLPRKAELPDLRSVAPEVAFRAQSEGARLLDLRPSPAYREAHAAGAVWAVRPRVREAANGARTVHLFAEDPTTARLASLDLTEAGVDAGLVAGGFPGWRDAGLPVEDTPGVPSDEEAIDFLFFVHDRHDGNLESSRRYLAWETGLIAQLDDQERAEFAR